jgi:hypothetical protein
MAQIFFGGKFSKLPFGAFFDQNLAKYAHFGLFLPNTTINVPHFHHRNIFFGLLKNGPKKIWGKILKIAFWGVF